MEVMFETLPRIAQEVDESSLFHKVVFFVDSNILHLLLRRNQVLHLLLLAGVSPLIDHLRGLVSSVDVVEVCELGTEHE